MDKKKKKAKTVNTVIIIILAVITCAANIVGVCRELNGMVIASSVLALFVTGWSIWDNINLQSKIDSYDEALKTKRDDDGNIKGITIDAGEF